MKRVVLNLGAGVQSSAIYALMADGEIPKADAAIFSDTQDEPAWVYEQLEFLKTLSGPKIYTVTAGRIGDDLKEGRNSTGQRSASIPSYTTYQIGEKGGQTRRQCTGEYKITPIEQFIRRTIFGCEPGKPIPKTSSVTCLFGFSTDESRRAVKMQRQYAGKPSNWSCEFPLFCDDIMMTRRDCQNYMDELYGKTWRSSRCVFCPYQRNHHWRELREFDPSGFQRACEVDSILRNPDAVVNRDMNEIMFVHEACVPLESANLDAGQQVMFSDDDLCDQGGCFL